MEVRRINRDELYHHGVKGQKWGVRRYQNYDGTWKNSTGKYKKKVNKLTLSDEKQADRLKRNSDRGFNKDLNKLKKKYDKGKISSAEYSKQKKQMKFANNIVNKSIQQTVTQRKRALESYYTLKNKSINDPTIKKTEQYKKAKSIINSRYINDYLLYGKQMSFTVDTYKNMFVNSTDEENQKKFNNIK